jgi:hypothetical protein
VVAGVRPRQSFNRSSLLIQERTFHPQLIQWGICAVEPKDHGEICGATFGGVVLQRQRHFRHEAPPLADNHWP